MVQMHLPQIKASGASSLHLALTQRLASLKGLHLAKHANS